MIDPDYVEKMTNNEWVEWNEKAFNDGFAYILKEGAPVDFVKEFEEFKSLFLQYG